MNQLTIYNNPAFGDVRTTVIDGEPWFVAADVCRCIDIRNNRDALTRLDDDEKGVVSTDTPGGKQDMAAVNEPGLYKLIMSSRKPEAKAFTRWITHEVLPSIRKTGKYINPKAAPAVDELKRKRLEIMETNARSRVAKQMMRLWDKAGVRAQDQALAMNSYYDGLSLPRSAFSDLTDALLDKTTIAKHLGVMSKSGAPHAHAIGAIIGKLTLEDGESQKTPYSRNGHDGEAEQYTPSVEAKVKAWLEENNYPTKISSGDKNYSVRYSS